MEEWGMSFEMLLLLAVALAMDAMAVSTVQGGALSRVGLRQTVLVALVFGGFQACMPALGWAVGQRFAPKIEAWDHWVAFGLLAAIGGKMLLDAWTDDGDRPEASEQLSLRLLLLLGVATSIDALAAGISLPLMNAPFAASIAIIGIVTALLSASGLWLGRSFGHVLGGRLDALGGLLLIGIGTRILVEHLSA